MAADLVIYGLVAAGLVFWLKNILGTRTGDERERPNPFTQAAETQKQAPQAAAAPGVLPGYEELAPAPLERHMSIATPAAERGLLAVAQIDRGFSPAFFLGAAQEAFVMIVEAFARGDRETLGDLLHPAVYKGFDEALRQRAAAGETASVEIHAVRKIEVLDARVESGRMAYITVRFIADETNVLRDRDGKPISGHPDRVTETNDIWTFGRDLRGRDPAWLVYETREGAEAGSASADQAQDGEM